MFIHLDHKGCKVFSTEGKKKLGAHCLVPDRPLLPSPLRDIQERFPSIRHTAALLHTQRTALQLLQKSTSLLPNSHYANMTLEPQAGGSTAQLSDMSKAPRGVPGRDEVKWVSAGFIRKTGTALERRWLCALVSTLASAVFSACSITHD